MSGRRRARRSARAVLLRVLGALVALAVVVGLAVVGVRWVTGDDTPTASSGGAGTAASDATPSVADGTSSTEASPSPSASSSAAGASPSTSSAAGGSASASRTATPAADRPRDGACYRLGYDAVVSPTNGARSVACRTRHTAQTFAVTTLDTVVDGHLLAVDADLVTSQGQDVCPARLVRYLGGGEEQWRLSMLRSVWFTPSLDEAAAGASWLRCDVVLRSGSSLGRLGTDLEGVLSTQDGRDTYGMCGTAEPGTSSFSRVPCRENHSWRAISTVDVSGDDGAYPGRAAARSAGQSTCEDAGRSAADDALDFQWGYEWPTAEQWDAGQTWGYCWAPA
ncbi:septum formation family protein [Nocardioides bruguierae]|uniref:Septum formation family protein n=1 Tax=Nocardioides bruguierae TaxID=2945102 RepID=A0A9X2DAF3_9ACTN|nr:septum formation family protein [Nocardioides bruguierae]MCM0622263.1 septum formation family protein [Nocardioides bruguierae]